MTCRGVKRRLQEYLITDIDIQDGLYNEIKQHITEIIFGYLAGIKKSFHGLFIRQRDKANLPLSKFYFFGGCVV